MHDVTGPVPDIATLPGVNGQCSATVTDVPTATDNCSGDGIQGTTSDALIYNTQGDFLVTWTYTDDDNNPTTQTQAVHVHDTQNSNDHL